MIKFIHLDYRKPHNAFERSAFGQTTVDDKTAYIFINSGLHRKGKNLIDTFFHEIVHAFVGFHGKKGQMSDAKEEKLAREVGRICAEALK